MNRPLRVAILIAAKNEAEHLGQTLQSIRRQRGNYDVFVVDDGSEDNTGQIAKSFGARVIPLEVPSGRKSEAQQRALPFLRDYELVITLDADTELEKDAILNILDPFLSENPPDAACGFILPKRRRTPFQLKRWIEYLVGQRGPKWIQSRLNMILVLSGCFACWRVDRLSALQWFQTDVWLAEDMGMTTRLLTREPRFGKNRPRAVLVPSAIALTLDPATPRVYIRQISRWYAGFFQNIRLHKKELFLFRNPGLTPLVCYALVDGILLPLLYISIPILALTLGWTWEFQYITKFLIGLLIIQFFMILGIALLQDLVLLRKRCRNWLHTIFILPWRLLQIAFAVCCLFVISVCIDTFVFLWRFAAELIFRKPLTVWNKGH